MRGALDLGTSLLYAQVKKANSDHKVEPESNLLRSKHFHVGKPVYLGNVAIRLISQLSQPDTPFFVQPPSFNEQVWQLTCKSSSISISVDSSSYWGAGLFNSGYLNRIEITGPLQERARIIFDLVATLSHNPWEFSHLRSARKMLHKESISLEENEKSWRNLMQVASSNMEERIAVLAERTNKVDKRVTMNKNKKGFDHKMSNASLQSAIHDLEVARAAHADDNSPAVERALARVEASLINADPSSQIESDEQLLQDELPDGHILPIDDDENVDIVDLSESEEDAEVLTEKDVIIAGMSQIIEEE
ncbi:MAG: hypothetical protein HOL72_05555 [Euryarchaeota archaeon]|jgi:hypothetical protein|nr:hypothetical protein [Euryarchaeota archaeon]